MDTEDSTGYFRSVRFQILKDKSGGFIWRLIAANNQIVAYSAQSYSSRAAAVQALQLVKTAAPGAVVLDATE
jgi:uncharacterized protein YegP (UPF0339 family)